MLSTQMCK